MKKVHLLRVFTNADGNFGDTASVVIDEGRQIPNAKRLSLAAKINSVETVFINDIAGADISIMHTHGELDFAGVPALGAAWVLSHLNGKPINVMNCRAGKIHVSQDGELTWVRANIAVLPAWNLKQLASAETVECVKLEETKAWQHTMIWAWIDEAMGHMRARTFAADWDIPEAEGNGSGAMLLAAQLNKSIQIKHGKGSVVFAKPAPNNCADVGGHICSHSSSVPPSLASIINL